MAYESIEQHTVKVIDVETRKECKEHKQAPFNLVTVFANTLTGINYNETGYEEPRGFGYQFFGELKDGTPYFACDIDGFETAEDAEQAALDKIKFEIDDMANPTFMIPF